MTTKKHHLIIAGVPRSGSTSLYSYLLRHPAICPSSTKETQHFLPANDGLPVGTYTEYLDYFAHGEDEPILLEASPSYFYGGARTAKAIRDVVGEAKLIFIFRDPARRLFSYFTHDKMYGLIHKDAVFEAFLQSPEAQEQNIIASGYYVDYFQGWHEQFADNIKVLFFEDLKERPEETMVSICEWLGIDKALYEDYNFTVENRGAVYKNKRLHMFARTVNDKFELFLRQNLYLKHALRRLYYALNEDQTQPTTLLPETYTNLANHYKPYNRRLANFLISHDYPLSGWLAEK